MVHGMEMGELRHIPVGKDQQIDSKILKLVNWVMAMGFYS